MSSETPAPSRDHLLIGLEGTNPLAALAALGTLRVLSEHRSDDDVRMSWQLYGGQWRPSVHFEEPLTTDEVVQRIYDAVDIDDEPREFSFPKSNGKPRNNLSDFTPQDFRDICLQELTEASVENRRIIDFCAAYGSDGIDPDEDQIGDTALRTMSGSGWQHFLGFMRKFVALTDRSHIHSALLARWDYADDKPSMRWDPHDDRRHALMAINPSNQCKGNEIRTMRGANRLAIEALPLFPTFPTKRGVKTRAFFEADRKIWLTWPIWEVPLKTRTVSSLLGHPSLLKPKVDRQALRKLGVCEIYRARRLSVGYFRNFAMGRPVAGC